MSDTNTSGLDSLRHASSAEVGQYYDAWSDAYDNDLADYGYNAPQLAAELLVEQGLKRESVVFDAGCGTGLVGQALAAKEFNNVIGADLSANSLRVAERKACYRQLFTQDLNTELVAEDDRFDAVVCVGTLSYVENPERLMTEFCRVGKPGASVLFTQRDDLYDDAFTAVLDRLVADCLWTRVHHGGPYPYLPNHPEFGDARSIMMDLYRVTG